MSTMKMKLKVRLAFVICVLFLLYVSVRILQPEFTGKKPADNQQEQTDAEPLDRESLVKKYISEYDIDFNSHMMRAEAWKTAAGWVNNRTIHPHHAKEIGGIMKHMSESKIIHADVGYGGSQLKLTLTLEGNQRVVFKPKWYERDYVVQGKPYDGRDRHNAEILAFHLNRMLGYARSPLVVGRTVDLMTEIIPVAEERLLKTFFHRGENTCFYGKCLYCKSEKDGVCGKGPLLEGVLILWLPKRVTFDKWKHPWRRTYREGKYMQWEVDNSYCSVVRKVWPYNTGPRLLDVMDAAVFDYLIGNADRHHYETFSGNNHSILVMLDSAKSLGNPHEDETSILAPVYQCCLLRRSTWSRLNELSDGVLTQVLSHILAKDPIAPVVASKHLEAMNRRLVYIQSVLNNCVQQKGLDNVIINDEYSAAIS